jgi:hypothetical protein
MKGLAMRISTWTSAVLLLLAILLLPSPGTACKDASCFRAQDCSRCQRSFLLDFHMGSSSERCGEGPWFGGEIGYLWNKGPEYGLGWKLFVGGDDCGERMGIRAVGRKWVNSQLSFEVGPGIVLAGAEGQAFPSVSLQLAMDIAGLIAPMFSLELIRPSEPPNSPGVWTTSAERAARWESILGVRVSSYGVPAALVALMIAVGASGGIMG